MYNQNINPEWIHYKILTYILKNYILYTTSILCSIYATKLLFKTSNGGGL